jgi:hypothetical protein
MENHNNAVVAIVCKTIKTVAAEASSTYLIITALPSTNVI